MLDAATARALGAAWFGRYLDADWRPRTTAESQALLAELGLEGPFWQLQPNGPDEAGPW